MFFRLTRSLASGKRRGHFLLWRTWSKAAGELLGPAAVLRFGTVRCCAANGLTSMCPLPKAAGLPAAQQRFTCPSTWQAGYLAKLCSGGRAATPKRLSHSVGSRRHLCTLLDQMMYCAALLAGTGWALVRERGTQLWPPPYDCGRRHECARYAARPLGCALSAGSSAWIYVL